ncbi:MAG TPA: methylmalonyl-CoA mutase family protein, partial [Acidobacteriota bacterium]|nr:methylmalonyl-CoA mutase family protein [Acidobacteriota bacterium]
GAQDERSQTLRFHAQTAGSSLTAQQPDNNVVRVTLQALAAVCGGAQSLHTNARDEALALPTEQSAKLALRTQQILAYESGAAAAADPLGGSWYVEHLTGQLEAEALHYMDKVRNLGGMLAAIESGYVQAEIQEAAYQHQKSLESGSEAVVGVNCFREDSHSPIEILRIEPELEMEQVRRLEEMRLRRDSEKVDALLASIRQAAAGTENLLPHLIDAVEALATVGEISNALRQVFGEHRETVAI